MEYRRFGRTDLELSTIALGGLLAHYEGFVGHPPPGEKHSPKGQQDYAANGPDPDADADLVIYNYVCRCQEAGLRKSLEAGTGVLVMKSLGGQWISWEDKAATDWEAADESRVIELSPRSATRIGRRISALSLRRQSRCPPRGARLAQPGSMSRTDP